MTDEGETMSGVIGGFSLEEVGFGLPIVGIRFKDWVDDDDGDGEAIHSE
jgi:hypothetical protein